MQSRPPSHRQLLWIQSPFAHWNSWMLQSVGCFSASFPTQFSGHSSEPSRQSLSPSQRHRAGTHKELLHWKDPELQVGLGQEASSEPSVQSLSLSHTKDLDMHWPLVQRNSSALHCLAAEREKGWHHVSGYETSHHYYKCLYTNTILQIIYQYIIYR